MQQRDELDELLQTRVDERELNDALGYGIVLGLALVIGIVALPAVIFAALLYATIVYGVKKNWILFLLLPVGLIGLLHITGADQWVSILGFLNWLGISFLTDLAVNHLNGGQPIAITGYSVFSAFCIGTILANIAHPIIQYYAKKVIRTKYGSLQKKRSGRGYKLLRKNRLKVLTKAQLKFRKSPSKANFIGFTEFEERVELDDSELNKHVLCVATTGGGKTVIIADFVENALRNNKPIVFMDGKGERASMLQFKALCEAYGKKVHLFTDLDEVSFNFMRHGSVTQLRDKIMNLFEWSEPYYKNNCSRFLQLVIRMMKDFDILVDLKHLYNLTFRSHVAALLTEQMEKAKQTVRLRLEEMDEMEDEEPPIQQVSAASSLFEGMENDEQTAAGAEPKPKASPPTKIVWDEELKAKVAYYRERFFGTSDDDEDEETGVNFNTLTNLRNQIAELMESDLGHLFEDTEDGIDLKKITDNDEVAIFSLSGNKYRDYIKTLGRLVISEVNTLVDYRQKAGKKSIFSVYDEFSAYVSHEVVDVINKSRSAGFECLISVQGLSDIDAVDPILTRQIINNCNTYCIGRVNESEDASTLAATLGTYEDADLTKQVQKKIFKIRFETEMGSSRSVQRFRAHPDEIKALSTGEMFLGRKSVEKDGGPYVERVYVRNALDLTGISA